MNEILESIVKRLKEVLSGIPVVNQIDGKVTQDLKLALAKSRVCALVFQEITPVMQLSGGESAIVATDVVFEAEAVL